ncbi:hypothetical protein AB1484_27660 [Parafrankia sp. FMc6]|uniref:hypothetical protein n=1 Tax=Parafrankia soli TaxID=2599596 RepID=UPI0034D46448
MAPLRDLGHPHQRGQPALPSLAGPTRDHGYPATEGNAGEPDHPRDLAPSRIRFHDLVGELHRTRPGERGECVDTGQPRTDDTGSQQRSHHDKRNDDEVRATYNVDHADRHDDDERGQRHCP